LHISHRITKSDTHCFSAVDTNPEISSLSSAYSVAGIQDIRNIFSHSETTKFPECF
jgi:hypothetical protein